jgi:hypothetical protein
MRNVSPVADDKRIQQALDELEAMIVGRYPAAEFLVVSGSDPEGIYLKPIVDVEDTEDVFDVVADRLLDLQIDDDLPIYVVPIRPLATIARMLAESGLVGKTSG